MIYSFYYLGITNPLLYKMGHNKDPRYSKCQKISVAIIGGMLSCNSDDMPI